MMWTSVLLTVVLCNAILQNPLDNMTSNEPASGRNTKDIETQNLINLKIANDVGEKVSYMNNSHVDELMVCLEKYIVSKTTINKNNMSENNFDTDAAEDINEVNVSSEINICLPKLFNHTTEDILNYLFHRLEEATGKDNGNKMQKVGNEDPSSCMLKAKIREHTDLLEFLVNADKICNISTRDTSFKVNITKEVSLPSIEKDNGSLTVHVNDNNGFNQNAECTIINGYSNTPIYVISTCRRPSFAGTNIWKLCNQRPPVSAARIHHGNSIYITQIPVQDHDGFVYRNVYCAQCNNAKVLHAWTTNITCENMQPLSLFDGKDTVTLLREFTNHGMGCVRKLSPAHPGMIHQCSPNKVLSTRRNHNIRTWMNHFIPPFPLRFSIFINFDANGKTNIVFTTSGQSGPSPCNTDETYEAQSKKCLSLGCHKGYHLVGRKCENIPSYHHDHDNLQSNVRIIDERSKVILSIENVTPRGIGKLSKPHTERLVIRILASMFNISSTRIQNLTLGLVNTSETSDRTDHKPVIHRFTTPFPCKIVSSNKKTKKLTHLDRNSSEQTESLATDRETFPRRHKSEIHLKHDKSACFIEHFEGCCNEKSDGNNETSLKTSYKSKDRDFTKQMINGSRLNVIITFVLNPAHENRSHLEMTVKKVVQSMSDLINKRFFHLSISGINFTVHGFENRPQDESNEVCKKGSRLKLVDKEFIIKTESINSKGRKENVSVIIVKETGERFSQGEYSLSIIVESSVGSISQTEVSRFAIVCKMPKILDEKCALIELHKYDYTLFENKDIEFGNRTYNMNEYEYVQLQDEVIRICTQAIKYTVWTLACGEDHVKMVNAESYLTFILAMTSLICMLLVLVTYGLFDKLRNLPGVNTMNLAFSLFMGELVFLMSGWIQPHQALLCSAVGMLLHYLFLAAFFWMNVMSFDVFKTFGNKCILTRVRKKEKYYPRYLLYAWGSPFLIVAFCGVLDYTDLIEGVKIGYGGRYVSDSVPDQEPQLTNSSVSDNSFGIHVYNLGCWIQRPMASMTTFGGPMILILLGNTVMFVRTIISIRSRTWATGSTLRRSSLKGDFSGMDDVKLYVRMSTFMGFTWYFGLISAVISAFADPTSHTICIVIHSLGIVFIVFNCSQGILIFFAFIFNRRVLAMYKGLLKKDKSKRCRLISVSSGNVTMTTRVRQSSLSHIA